jgi:capsular polysaccharide transport system permease protein
MIDKLRHGWLAPALMRRRTLSAALLAILLAALYWGLFASDRYVSEAHVIVQRTDLGGGQGVELASLLGTMGGPSGPDQLLLRDHLLSVDMLEKLDARLDLRSHYSDDRRDLLSRMWNRDTELEWFHRHYLSRVTVDYDEQAGVLVIQAQAYDPETAHAIASVLVEEGERFMNAMAHRLAQEQVSFLEQQVVEINARVLRARKAVLAFQNEHGLASPEGTAENLVTIINGLEARLADLQARRSAMLGYLMEDSADIVDLNLQIGAIERQIAQEQRRLAAPSGQALNETVEEYQRLQLEAGFSQDIYKTALVALEQVRIEATRTLKKLSVLQSPTQPQYPLEPRRLYNTVVFALLALLLAGIIHLMAAIIRDHKD